LIITGRLFTGGLHSPATNSTAQILCLPWHIRQLTAAATKWLKSGDHNYCPFKVFEWLYELDAYTSLSFSRPLETDRLNFGQNQPTWNLWKLFTQKAS